MTKTTEIEKLYHGSHTVKQIESGEACLVEAASYEAGAPKGRQDWRPSDSDDRVSRVIRSFCISLNDRLNDNDRQALLPYKAKIVGTVGTEKQEQLRGWMAADWLVHTSLPLWLRLAGLEDQALALEALPEITSDEIWNDQARPAIKGVREVTRPMRLAWREKIREAVAREFQKRGISAAAVDAVAVAAVDAVAVAAVDAVAVAVADAAAAAVAAVDAVAVDADAAAVADAAAAAVAVDAAVDAAVAAVAVDAAVDAEKGLSYSDVYWAVRKAIFEKVKTAVEEKVKPQQMSVRASAMDLLDRMIAVTDESEAA